MAEKRLCLILLVAFIFRLFIASFYPIVGDAHHHINGARYIAEHWAYPPREALVIGSEISFFYPPLIHFTYALLITMLDLNYSTYHLLNFMPLVAGTLSIYFVYKLVLNLKLSKDIAIKTAFVTSFLPIHIIFSGVLYLTIYMAFFVTASASYFLQYVNTNDKRSAFLAVVFTYLAGMSHLAGLSAALFQLLYLLLRSRKPWKLVLVSLLVASPMYVYKLFAYGNPLWIGDEGIQAYTNPMVWNGFEMFFSFWIGGPTSGPFFNRMIDYLPATLQVLVFPWTLLAITFTVIMFIGFYKIPREAKTLFISAIPPFLITANMTRKLMGSISSLALSIVVGISWISRKFKIREVFLLGLFILLSSHTLPLAYLMGARWAVYDSEYALVRGSCTTVLSSEVGRIAIMCDVNMVDFGQYGIDKSLLLSGDYESVLNQADSKGVDCIFYDDYTLTRMVDSQTADAVTGLMDYLKCEKQTVDDLGFYLCPI